MDESLYNLKALTAKLLKSGPLNEQIAFYKAEKN